MASIVLSAEYSDHISIKQNHYHDCHQLLFVTKGTADIFVNNTKHTVTAGHLVVFSRLEHHAVTAQSKDYQRFVLELTPDVPMLGAEGHRVFSVLFNRPEGFRNVLDVSDQQGEFHRWFEDICREKQTKAPMYKDMLNLLVQQLLIAIYRQVPDAFSAMGEDGLELVYKIQTLFHREYHSQFTLGELATAHNVSVSHLSHLFKATTGNSVMGYLQSCRVAEAKKCLAETNMRVGEIVEHCGFSDNSNFSRTFRNMTGFSPSQFRERFHK